MKSRTPKVLHAVCGKPMILYPVDLLRQLGLGRIVVVVSPGNGPAVRQLLGDSVEYATQPQVLGTGDAVSRAVELVGDQVEHILVQNADVPLVHSESMRRLWDCHASQDNQMTMLTVAGVLARDLGRVVRNEMGLVTDIVEAADWRGPRDAPAEVNVGTYCFQTGWLMNNLDLKCWGSTTGSS
jgi:bifunctional UDP-N-acetylglucosamine pyrophosphorylase/glucosamine-1-phosphate N-acetyltransferase